MKRSLALSLVLITVLLLMSAVAFADPRKPEKYGRRGGGPPNNGHGDNGGVEGAPEIDPTSLGAVVTLLGGGLAVLTDRRRKK